MLARAGAHLRDDLLASLRAEERRALAFLWADRAVRQHAVAALEAAGHLGGVQSLKALRDVTSPTAARRAAWRCFTVGVRTAFALGFRLLAAPVRGGDAVRQSARALYVLLDAVQAALVAISATGTHEVRMVADRAARAARGAPWQPTAPSAARGARAWAAGPEATMDAGEEDEATHQRQELAFAASVGADLVSSSSRVTSPALRSGRTSLDRASADRTGSRRDGAATAA